MAYLFALLAAIANAFSSVLQRKADKDEPSSENLSLRLIIDVLHRPIWFLGFLGVILGFLLQAAALGRGGLAVVEPILIFELPATLLLGSIVFRQRLHHREWIAALAMTVGLGGMLYCLSPSERAVVHVSAFRWSVGIVITLAVIAGLVMAARHWESGPHRAGLLGVATGASFGLTAALIKAMTSAFNERGIVAIFTTWQTYGMIVTGALAMFLLQSSLNAGTLVAAQPGITATDPVVSILWGTLVFGESVRGGVYLGLAALSAVVIAFGLVELSRSPLVIGDDNGAGKITDRARDRAATTDSTAPDTGR